MKVATFSLIIVAALVSSAQVKAFHQPLTRRQPVSSQTRLEVFGMVEASTALDGFFHAQPYLASLLTCSVKASTADLLAQSKAGDKKDDEHHIDMLRNLAFVLYGALYQGLGQTFIYTQIYPFLFGSEPTLSISG